MDKLHELQAFVDDMRWVGDQRAANMLQAALDDCRHGLMTDCKRDQAQDTIDAMHGAMEADDA